MAFTNSRRLISVALIVLFMLAILLALASAASAEPADAVVCIPSHGASGTVIATGDGWTLILSCAHAFEEPGDRAKPIKIKMPHCAPGMHKKVGVKLIACGSEKTTDLALIKLNDGPVPYVDQVAPLASVGPDCLSIGYDEMKTPAKVRPARIVATIDASTIKTDTSPYHGRSGGALIDKRTGWLVGVVSAYQFPKGYDAERAYHSGRHELRPGFGGMYVSLPAIHRFLAKAGVMQGNASDGAEDPFSAPLRRTEPLSIPRYGPCPGGSCPTPRYGPCPGGSCPIYR